MSYVDPVAKVGLPLAVSTPPKTVVTTCTTQSSIIKQCPAYATTPAVQTAVVAMDGTVTALSGTLGTIDNLHAQLLVLEKSRGVQLAAVFLAHDTVEAALNTASGGDPEAAQAWTGKTKERAKPTVVTGSTSPPVNPQLAIIKSQPGSVKASCDAEADATGFLFQQGSDPAHPETWPAPAVNNTRTFKVRNLTAGQMVYMRIAIVRRGAVLGQWSPVLQVQVR